jgi:hypothetical protein
MFKRLAGWWQLWMTLTVTWTIVVITYGWMNLPRGQQMPHDSQYLTKLSNEASSILFGSEARAEPPHNALVWSQTPMIVRMSNGTRLTFPATTTGERVAFVRGEYSQLLDVKADEQRGPYLLEMLAIWLAPLLIAGFAVSRICRGYKPPLGRVIPGGHSPASIGKAVASALFHAMFANEQRKPRERVTIYASLSKSVTCLRAMPRLVASIKPRCASVSRKR